MRRLFAIALSLFALPAFGQISLGTCGTETVCGNSTSCEIPLPTHSNGDRIIAFGYASDSGGVLNGEFPLYFNESGLDVDVSEGGDSGTDRAVTVASKEADSEPANWTLQLTANTEGTEDLRGVACLITGVDSTTPEDTTATSVEDDTNTTTHAPAAITTVTDDAMVITVAGAGGGVSNFTPSTNYTEFVDYANLLYVQYRIIASSGAETPGTIGGGAAGTDWSSLTIALRPASSGPTLTGVTISAAANGFNLQGTLTGSGTLTAYGVACEPALSDPSIAQVVAGNCQDGSAALFSGSEVWTTAVQNDFDITDVDAAVRYNVCLAGNDGTTDSDVVSCSELSRSADASQTIVELSAAIASTSAFALQSENTCDATSGSPTLTGCADTSWIIPGMLVDLSAGFADLTDVIVESVSADSITLETAANATSANITVTQDAYYSPTVATGDWLEHDNSVTCNAGSDAVTIGTDGEISYTATTCGATYTQLDYCIQDDSSTAGVSFSEPDCWSTDDTFYFFNERPDFLLDELPLVLDINTAMTPYSLTSFCTDPDGGSVTIAVRSGSVPTGLTFSGNQFTGTPTVENESGVFLDMTCADEGGLYASDVQPIYIVETVEMPTLTDGDLDAALTDVASSFPWRVDDLNVTAVFRCDNTEAANEVLTQTPTASSEVAADVAITLELASPALCGILRRRQ